MSKGIRKIISTVCTLTIICQILLSIVPIFQIEVWAVEGDLKNADMKEMTDEEQTNEEVSTEYEVKDEEIWDISVDGDGSIIAKWTLKDRTLTITGTGKMKDWWDTSNDNGWNQTKYQALIQKVVISDGITGIGRKAFQGFTSMTSIKMPEGLKTIGESAFRDCINLETIEIPESVETIESNAFIKCKKFTKINIPKNVTNIGDSIFFFFL